MGTMSSGEGANVAELGCCLLLSEVDGVSPSVFRCTSTPMETGPIDACVET